MKRKATDTARGARRGARATPRFEVRVVGAARPRRAVARAGADPNVQADDAIEQARAAIVAANVELHRQMLELIALNPLTPSDIEKHRKMSEAVNELLAKEAELAAIEFRKLLDDPAVDAALARLRGVTARLERTAQEIKTATQVIQKITRILGFVDEALGILRQLPGLP